MGLVLRNDYVIAEQWLSFIGSTHPTNLWSIMNMYVIIHLPTEIKRKLTAGMF